MVLAILGLARVASAPNLTLLYAGLEPQAAGQIIQALEQQGVTHEVRGGAIYVDAAARDGLRLTLASEGMPSNNAQGYELLDSLTGFGTTSQMFDAAYLRAKEGELARTIVASPNVTSARVHLATASSAPFQRSTKATASVTVTTTTKNLSAAQVEAIRYLVASAVASLLPEDVAIIDSVSGLITGTDTQPRSVPGAEISDTMRERILRLLEARVGPGNAMVEVNISTELETESIRERRVDPSSRVAISTETEEANTESIGSPGGNVTVAANLPDGDAGAQDNSKSVNSQTRERINYEVSETSREVIRAPGTVKRMTIAVLVNQVEQPDQDGVPNTAPRTEEELTALKDLVASVSGFDESRGDLITIKSMEFLKSPALGTEASATLLQKFALNPMSMIQLAVLSIVLLILGLFVLRPILQSAAGMADDSGFNDSPRLANENTFGGFNTVPSLTGEIEEDGFNFGAMPLAFTPAGATSNEESEDPIDRLKNLISQRQNETVEVLRGWLEDRGETTR